MGWSTIWACLRAWRIGDESQQPTCPQDRHSRRCSHGVCRRRHSSQPSGVLGVTWRIAAKSGSTNTDVMIEPPWLSLTLRGKANYAVQQLVRHPTDAPTADRHRGAAESEPHVR